MPASTLNSPTTHDAYANEHLIPAKDTLIAMDNVGKQPQELDTAMMRCPTTSTTSSPQSEDDNDNTSDSISTEVLSAESCDSFCTTRPRSSSQSLPIDHLAMSEPVLLERIFEDNLSTEILSRYEELLPVRDSYDRRICLIRAIERLLNTEWPDRDIRVHLFGSSVNDLGTSQSDVDLCITTPWSGLRNVRVLAKLFKRCGMQHVVCVPRAKVPIVRLFDPETQLACDINVNNTSALQNTEMIKTYVALDPRVRPLIMIIKYWTKQRRLNDAANGGTLSTYTWTCMALNFLQMRQPPILPVLHQLAGSKDDDSFCTDIDLLRGLREDNHETLGGLLYAFFRHYAVEFDYADQVVSVRNGRYLSKEEKGWDVGRNKLSLCVEEPFNVSRNLGNSADQASVQGLVVEFQRACHLLAAGSSLDLVCSHYDPFPMNDKDLDGLSPQSTAVRRRSANSTAVRPNVLPVHPMDSASPTPTTHDDTFDAAASSSSFSSSSTLIPSIPIYDIRYVDAPSHRPRFNSAIVHSHSHSSISGHPSSCSPKPTRTARHSSQPTAYCTTTTAITGGPTPIAITIALPPPSSKHHRVVPPDTQTVDSIFARYSNNTGHLDTCAERRRSNSNIQQHRRASLISSAAYRRPSTNEWPTIAPTPSSAATWDATARQQQPPHRRRRWSTVKKTEDSSAPAPRRTMAEVVKTRNGTSSTGNNKINGTDGQHQRHHHPARPKSDASGNGLAPSSSGVGHNSNSGSSRQRRRNKQSQHR